MTLDKEKRSRPIYLSAMPDRIFLRLHFVLVTVFALFTYLFYPSTFESAEMTIPAAYDALIVGSGPAGLSVALSLARVRRRAAIFTKPNNAGFRNEGAAEMHNVISRDGTPPAEFRRIATEQIQKYGTIDFIEADVVDMKRNEDVGNGSLSSFDVVARDGRTWYGRKLALAMGSVEVFPDIEGYRENWPRNM